jgi:hypothetical protein
MATINFENSTPVTRIHTTSLQDSQHALFLQCGNESSYLSAQDGLDLLAFLYEQRDSLYELAHQEDKLTDEQMKIQAYNRDLDERNAIAAENREKPWLPSYDGGD